MYSRHSPGKKNELSCREILMKSVLLIGAVAALIAGTTELWASSATGSTQAVSEQFTLVLAGPVESINDKDGTAVVLGQKLLLGQRDGVAVGDAVSVFGKMRSDGSVSVAKIIDHGIYVPGATPILLTGLVQQVHAAVGRATVNGVNVDLTAIYAVEASSTLAKGSLVQVSGTQPASRGLVLADAIVGGGQSNAIVGGGGLNAIVGGGNSNAIVGGGGLNAIVGGGNSNAIVGGGGLNAIVGGGNSNAIVGGGGLNAIVGGGKPSAIVGGGL
jgi:hypothetical protein